MAGRGGVMENQLIRHTAGGNSVWLNLANVAYIERQGPYLTVNFTTERSVTFYSSEADQLEAALDQHSYPVALMHRESRA